MEKDFSKEVLEKIKKERIRPKSKWRFALKDSAVWSVFAASIALGALSFSVILHFWEINDWDAYYRISENFLAFMLITMPYFWFICFVLFVFLAYFYLKHTRTGYRLELARVLAWNLGLSLIFGSVLYSVGAGRRAESEFAERSPFYKELRDEQETIWFRPERGVIVGRVTYVASGGEMLKLDDPHEITWVVDASDTDYFQGFAVREGFMIKVFGEQGEDNFFIAQEIRPLLRERGVRMAPAMEEWPRQ